MLNSDEKAAANAALHCAKKVLGGTWAALADTLNTEAAKQGRDAQITPQGAHAWLAANRVVPSYWAKVMDDLTRGKRGPNRVRKEVLRPDTWQ